MDFTCSEKVSTKIFLKKRSSFWGKIEVLMSSITRPQQSIFLSDSSFSAGIQHFIVIHKWRAPSTLASWLHVDFPKVKASFQPLDYSVTIASMVFWEGKVTNVLRFCSHSFVEMSKKWQDPRRSMGWQKLTPFLTLIWVVMYALAGDGVELMIDRKLMTFYWGSGLNTFGLQRDSIESRNWSE